ncbi:Eukaryotic aspartyl protease family protein [Rhynchospora pubera]|uniref:Eukaryotic aspartyl protease family protein n=1 Tax=Rhynchospora pubera TaxID=906938 RepID=A0AAV8G157_9POAL|nr:Eukaryotic aspartyl protease family protein [Rhynchospora pubera]
MGNGLFTLLQIYLLFVSFSTSALGLRKLHVVDVRAFTSRNVCSGPKDVERHMSVKQGLKIVDRHGPCSTLPPVEKLSPEQILSNDQSRVDSIHRQTSAVSGKDKTSGPLNTSQVTAQYGGSYSTANYIVSVGIGTPSKTLTVIFDTGSDITWVQCEPCQQHCYMQKDPIFDPSQSSTFANVSCNSAQCTGNSFGCSGSSCLYGDGSFTVGYYAKDTLTLTPDVIQNFRFGCGQNNDGIFWEIAGLLGLGPSSESFVSQTSDKYQRVFAYCLPALSSSTGYLNFGSSSNMPNTKRTPIPQHSDPPYYYITMTGLTVADQPLQITSTVFSNAGMIIDSGTVITRLPPDAYQALRSAFRQHMTQYKMAPSTTLLDTCYDFTGYDNVTIPSVSVQFLNNVSLELDPNGIFYVIDISQVCLAFAGNSNPRDLGIYGNVQQRTFNVIYDVPNEEIGFNPEAC